MDALGPLLRLASLLALLVLVLAPAARADDRTEYEQRRLALELECAQRHVDLGIWCRDRGFTEVAREHFLEAVEVSGGRHAHANNIKSLMDRAGAGFWKKEVELSDKRRKPYDKQLAKLEQENAEGHFALATWAFEKGLEEEALSGFRALLDPDAPLAVGKKGRLETRAGEIPAACSELILADAIAINGRPHVRHGVLELLAGVDAISEAASGALLVRTTGALEEAEDYLELGVALLPELEAELGMRFARRPTLFLFPARGEYERYLVEADRQSYRSVSGFADPFRSVTVVCTEGKSRLDVQSLALHELSHLADAYAFPQPMPAWYREGFAETFGGPGTFAWDGAQLTLRGELDAQRLALLRGAGRPWPIAELVRIDPLSLWGSDQEQAMRFYAQSWALYRWLSREAPSGLRERWDAWTEACKRAQRVFPPGPAPVATPEELFQQHFAGALEEIDRGLASWLEAR